MIQQTWKRGGIPDVIGGQIGADDLTADKIESEVQFAPRPPFALGFMLILSPLDRIVDLQPGAIPCLAGDKYRREGTTNCIPAWGRWPAAERAMSG